MRMEMRMEILVALESLSCDSAYPVDLADLVNTMRRRHGVDVAAGGGATRNFKLKRCFVYIYKKLAS